MFLRLCNLAARPLWEMNSMMEWGPGGGANAVAFASSMKRFVGVDISAANIEECIRQFGERGLMTKTALHPVIVDISAPESALENMGDKADFFLSTAVYQHFPSMKYGERVTRIANNALCPNGLAIIQIRLNDGTPNFQSKCADYALEFLSFTCYTIEEFDKIVLDCGFETLDREFIEDVNYVYYLLKKTREVDLSF
jgi:cyclopropane fatty-acyl-phospholipid synthase-like methyltransferase